MTLCRNRGFIYDPFAGVVWAGFAPVNLPQIFQFLHTPLDCPEVVTYRQGYLGLGWDVIRGMALQVNQYQFRNTVMAREHVVIDLGISLTGTGFLCSHKLVILLGDNPWVVLLLDL